MLAPSRGRVLERKAASFTLPSFLLPAFQSSAGASTGAHNSSITSRRQFSNTAGRASKLGRTPISIPPGVDISIGEPWIKKDLTTYLRIPKRTLTVQGPLGKLELTIPPYIKIDHDVEARKALLSIEDINERQQMAMWGMYICALISYLAVTSAVPPPAAGAHIT